MTGLRAALSVELLKARRSRVPWAISAGFCLAPLVGGLFMVILKNPEAARRLGLLGTKAQLTAGTADWPTFLGLLAEAVAIGGAVLFAFFTVWIYGREFSDRTVRVLLATPTSRSALVLAKAMVLIAWGLATSIGVLGLGLLVGALVDIPGWSSSLAAETIGRCLLAAVLALALQSATAFVAGVGRGYLPALGFVFLTVFLAQVVAALGLGAWFPWAVPALVSGVTGPGGETATAFSVGLVAVASAIGLWATLRWWSRADQTT